MKATVAERAGARKRRLRGDESGDGNAVTATFVRVN